MVIRKLEYPYRTGELTSQGAVSQVSLYRDSVEVVSPEGMDVELYPGRGTWEFVTITHRPSKVDIHTLGTSIVMQLYWNYQL